MSNKAKIREEVETLNPIDDLMFRKMAEDKEFCEEILRVILEDKELIVEESIPQWTGTNLQGRSVILDAKCVKGDGTQVNIEVQKSDYDNHQKRVRYNGSILTTNVSDPGIKFDKVPDVCVVYISTFNVFEFEENIPVYHVERVVRENGEVVKNGFEEVYVNASVRDGSEVSQLMKVFVEDDAYSDKFPKTSEGKYRYKKSEEGVEIMYGYTERIWNQGLEEGLKEGFEKGESAGFAKGETGKARETALNLKNMGMNPDQIAKAVNVEEQIVKEWLEGKAV